MITPHHIIYNLTLLDRNNDNLPETINKKTTWSIALGAIFPDSFTYLFFLIYGVFLSMPHEKMWDDMYFNSGWNNVFNLAHSLWLLPLLSVLFFVWKKKYAMYFFLSATIHALMDLLVHAYDAYAHFYPFSMAKFHSPISYYDSHYYGNYVSIVTHIAAVICLVILYKRFKKRDLKSSMYICLVYGILELIAVVIFSAMLIYSHI